jgi:hypothetical protein
MKKNQFLVNELPYIKEKTSEINYSTVQLFVIFRFAVSTLNFQSINCQPKTYLYFLVMSSVCSVCWLLQWVDWGPMVYTVLYPDLHME